MNKSRLTGCIYWRDKKTTN